jgi:hypothetical protein
MHLRRTPCEAVIEGTQRELEAIGRAVQALEVSSTTSFESGPPSTGRKLVVTENGKPALATWQDEVGLVLEGSRESLVSFSEQFFFHCEPVAKVHNHWDLAGIFDFVAPKSIPIVIQLSEEPA